MSNETITLAANKRDVLGKQVRGLRNEGNTPAVIHDHGKASIHVSIEEKELKKVYLKAGKHHTVVLDVDGKKYTTIIKEVTNRPASAQLYHTVFQAVSATETIKTEIPLKLVGEIPAEKASLLVLQHIDTVEIEAVSSALVDAIDVDATLLVADGDKIHVSDIEAPKGVTIMTDGEQVVASVEIPKNQEAEADAAAAELAADAADGAEVPTEATAEADSEEAPKEA